MIETVIRNRDVCLNARVRSGSGPTLLLAHSVGCDNSLWNPLIALLPTDYHLIAYDMRGHGESDARAGEYDAAQLADDAIAILDALGVARGHVCGLSLGGTVAHWLALHRPDRLASITLANTAARLGTIENWNARIAAARDGGMAGLVEMSMARFFSPGFRARQHESVDHFRRVFLATPAQGFAGCCAALRDADTRSDLARITVPTLVIGGTLDEPTPPADSEALARGIPGAVLTLLETGHLSAVEDAPAFAAALIRHIETADEALA